MSNKIITNDPMTSASIPSNNPTHPDVMYDIAPRNNGGWLLTEKETPGQPRLKATARGEHSKVIPRELHTPRYLAQQELDTVGYHSLDDNKPVFAKAMVGRKVFEVLEAQTFSPQHMHDIGVWDKLVELRSLILKPGMAEHLSSFESRQVRKRKGTTYNIAWAVDPTGRVGSVRPGVIAKANDPQVKRIVELVSGISFQMVRNADGAWTEEHERQWIKEASLTCGGGDNKSVTSIQINLSAIKKQDEGAMKDTQGQVQDASSSSNSTKMPEDVVQDTLKDKSHVHKDSNDERRNFSCILFMNHVPDDYFVGRFNITNLRLTCTCIPYSGLVFTANNPHGGSGFAPYEADLPMDSPLRFTPIYPAEVQVPRLPKDSPYTRCLTIAYSRQDCMRARTKQVSVKATSDEGLGAFVTRKAQANWMIRHAIRDGTDIGVANPRVEDYLEKFSWVEDGVKYFEKRKLVEDALALKGTDNKKWEEMLKATAYNSAHLKRDSPGKYESKRQRLAKESRAALGQDAFCPQITGQGTRCKAWLAKNTGSVKLCAAHYKIFLASQAGATASSGGSGSEADLEQNEDEPEGAAESEAELEPLRGQKRLREEESEEEAEADGDFDDDVDEIHFSSRRVTRGPKYDGLSPKRARYGISDWSACSY